MKKRFIAAFAAIALFMMAIAAYAYTQQRGVLLGDKSCCCKGDGESCPMKAKGHDGHDGHDAKGEHAGMSCCKKHDGEHAEHAKGEGHSCCGDSCPMKKGEGTATTVSMSKDGKGCCDCCGDSCPMKKGDAAATAGSASNEGKSCCDCCGDSCPMKKEKPKTTA